MNQLTKPCPKCPFRTDIPPYLTKGRVKEIEQGCVERQGEFWCHATCDYTSERAAESDGRAGDKALRCAGLTILMEKIGKSTQMMRIEERLGMYDHTKMDMAAPVYDSFAAMRKAQSR